MVYIDSWEYPTDFLFLQSKAKFNGYPLILGRPWLATVNTYISYRSKNITITNRKSRKQLLLYPPPQTPDEDDFPTWVEEEEEENSCLATSYHVCTLETTTRSRKIDEDNLFDNFLQKQYLVSMNIDGLQEESYIAQASCSQEISWVDLLISCSEKNNVKTIEINPL